MLNQEKIDSVISTTDIPHQIAFEILSVKQYMYHVIHRYPACFWPFIDTMDDNGEIMSNYDIQFSIAG